MKEIIANIHVHTLLSDGSGTHKSIAKAAASTGVDVVIITDHNNLQKENERYYYLDNKIILLLIGEEVHDITRTSQKNHLIVYGLKNEVSSMARDPQSLINYINTYEGLSFIAHPYETDLQEFGEPDISWVDWDIQGFTGLEIWNQLSDFKFAANSKLSACFYALFPQLILNKPQRDTIGKWDELTQKGAHIVAIGGTDSHALHKSLGPINKTIFPYDFHFRCINTHLLVNKPLTGEIVADRAMIMKSLRFGNCFIGYDLPKRTEGFRFNAVSHDKTAIMGEEIIKRDYVKLQIHNPSKCDCQLMMNGKVLQKWMNKKDCEMIVDQPGVYRVESYIHYLGKSRGWIYSNPIYVN